MLKNRGFVEVEHISETGIRNYFIMNIPNMFRLNEKFLNEYGTRFFNLND